MFVGKSMFGKRMCSFQVTDLKNESTRGGIGGKYKIYGVCPGAIESLLIQSLLLNCRKVTWW